MFILEEWNYSGVKNSGMNNDFPLQESDEKKKEENVVWKEKALERSSAVVRVGAAKEAQPEEN